MEKLVQKTPLKDHKHFIYAVYKQQYLELIEQLEYQKVHLQFLALRFHNLLKGSIFVT